MSKLRPTFCSGLVESDGHRNVEIGNSKNPHADWKGFWINHVMVPWLDYGDLLRRQAEYDEVHFRNEVLGLLTALGDHVISLAELEACCTGGVLMMSAVNVQHHLRNWLVAGVDWGGGGKAHTAVCIGYLDPRTRHFTVVHFSKFRRREDPLSVINQVAALCRNFGVVGIGADAGNGLVNNRLLWAEYRAQYPLTAIR